MPGGEGVRAAQRAHGAGIAKTVGALALLQVALPFNAALTAAALVRRAVVRPRRPVIDEPRTILISGGKMTKALQLARSFHQAGHRVVLVESGKYRLTGHRFSRCVDRFHTVPRPQDPGYAEALLQIVRSEGVDVYIPVCSPASSYYDALAKPLLAEYCEVVHGDVETIARLDDKYEFAMMAAELGLSVPESHRVTSASQVADFDFGASPGPFVLKSISYDPLHRLDLTPLPRATPAQTATFAGLKPIAVGNPWIMQSFVAGQEYCTHGTARDGELVVYCCCESSAFQLNYKMVDQPEIEAWVRQFVAELKLTGQFSFDFMKAADGRVYAIECNPRTHSAITMFYNHPGLAAAYLDDPTGTITPLPSSRPTYWLYQELWRLLRHPMTAPQRWQTVREGKDAIFDWSDPLPFLLVHHLQIPSLLLYNLRHGRPWIKIDFNIGKLIEPGGD